MLDSAEQPLDKIRLGEDSFLECKEMVFAARRVKGPTRNVLADELAAFANARGGVLLLGVHDDTKDVVGILEGHLDLAEQYASEIVRDSISPPLYPVIERMQLPGTDGQLRPVLRVEVARSLFVHRSPGGFLHRVGSNKRVMDPDYLARLFQQRSQARLISFDEQAVHDASKGDLDRALVDRFRTPQTQDDSTTLARKLGMATETEGGEPRPTHEPGNALAPDPLPFLLQLRMDPGRSVGLPRILVHFPDPRRERRVRLGTRRRLAPAPSVMVVSRYLCKRGWGVRGGWTARERKRKLLVNVHHHMNPGSPGLRQQVRNRKGASSWKRWLKLSGPRKMSYGRI